MRIGIIGAMEEEVVILRDKITELRQEVIGNCEFNLGKLQGVDVILLRSGIGKVNAAIATTILLEKYAPNYVINTGSAGGFHPDLKIGDLVISTEVRHHDVDATIFNYEHGQVPGLPASFIAEEKLIQIAEQCAKEIGNGQTKRGLIVTGDSFIDDLVKVDVVKQNFPEVLAAEMEGAAIAQVAHQFAVPFVVIRAISDYADRESGVTFEQFLETAAVNSATLVMKMIKKITT